MVRGAQARRGHTKHWAAPATACGGQELREQGEKRKSGAGHVGLVGMEESPGRRAVRGVRKEQEGGSTTPLGSESPR